MQRTIVTCSRAGLGFGDGSSGKSRSAPSKGSRRRKEAGVRSDDSRAVEKAVRLVEQQEGKRRQGPAGVRPIDPKEAARGKVEYVKVKDWGSGQPEDLGGLQVQEQVKVFEAGGAAGQPFHETLARRLELLQTQGGLGVAQPKGGKPLPDFQRWAFALEHYVQYLADLHAVHAALEGSLASAAAELASPAASAVGSQQQREQLRQAVSLFGAEQGLDRAAALLQDLRHLAARQQQQQQQQQAAEAGAPFSVPAASQHAAAYAAYLASLGRLCSAADEVAELEQSLLRLLANAYMLHLMHLTSGGRITAAAAGKLDLAGAGALAFHTSYPGLDARLGPGAKPLEAFVAATNSLGQLLSEEQREALMEELGKAMTKSSMLLGALAKEA